MSGPLETARAAWGQDLPDWVERLAVECAASSQNRVAARLRRSPSMVSGVLRNRYKGDMTAIEDLVRGVFERQRVACPVLGEIRRDVCRDWRAKSQTYSNVNSTRQRMFRACNACPRNRKDQD
ncbi:hypothetical protein JYP51_09555 [Ponticoccus gilvus]|nr:hypothetical protein [Enemella evansiae]